MVLTGTHVINDTGHTADHNLLDVAINTSRVPVGGTINQVLKKNSSVDGDSGWVTPTSVEHTNVPLAASGAGTPGSLATASANDHVHPASNAGGAGGIDANMAIIPASTSSGFVASVTAGNGTNNTFGPRANAYPCRVSNSGTFFMGIEVTTAVAASFVRIAVFQDSTTGTPGTLVFDSGQLDSSIVGVRYAATSTTLVAGTRYWFVVAGEAGGPSIRAGFGQSLIPVGITSGSSYPGNSYRLGVGPYASNPTIVATDGQLACPAFLLKVP